MVRIARSLSLAALGLLSLASTLPAQQHYTQTNLISDIPGMAATTDPNLKNPWGMSRGTGSPWWISDNGTGLTTLDLGTGAPAALGQTCPAGANTNCVIVPSGDPNSSPTGTPTGQVFNNTADFKLPNGNPAKFIFATEDGTISGWNGGPTAVIKVNTKSASVFKGMTIATVKRPDGTLTNQLYVADFRMGRVEIFDTNFHRMPLSNDAFRDDRVPEGYAPFNVQNIGGNICVAFAEADSQGHDDVPGAGHGYVDVFTTTGHLLLRLQHGNWFNSPWGIAQAPTDFGLFSHDLLVGQFGSGQILVFNPVTGAFRGTLNDASDKPITIDGLWDIAFGSGGPSGPANNLFFTAGLNDEADGLFGMIAPVENALGGDL